jgi:hypothetical protein
LVDQTFRGNGLLNPGEIHQAPLDKLREIFGYENHPELKGSHVILYTYSLLTRYHLKDSNYRLDTVRAMNQPGGSAAHERRMRRIYGFN